jgi:ubiquinone/menaquinone biosynthesis C-methylase UbiE
VDAAKLKAALTYNAAADSFDSEPLGFWSRIGLRTVDLLELEPGARVLDVGCGAGSSAIPAAEKIGPSGHVIGVDLAEKLLELADRKASARRLTNVTFEVGDMERLTYPDCWFDAVVSVFSLFFASDMVAQTRELWRMVRPGGRLAITTWGPRVLEPGASAWWAAVEEVRPDLVSFIRPWERIVDSDSLRAVFEEAGIPDVQVIEEDGRQLLRSTDDWWTIVLGSGFRWTVEQLDSAAIARVRSLNLERIEIGGVAAVEANALFAIARKAV